MSNYIARCQGLNAGYLGGDHSIRRGHGFGMHAIIAEGIRSVDGWKQKNTSSAAHMVKIGTAHEPVQCSHDCCHSGAMHARL